VPGQVLEFSDLAATVGDRAPCRFECQATLVEAQRGPAEQAQVSQVGVDREAPLLRAHEERARGARIDRMETMVARLRKAGVLVEMEAVLLAAGAGGGVLGRPHLARALMASGHVGSLQEAFHRYIGEGLPAFQPLSLLDPVQGVEVIVAAGGIAVWAHPPRERVDALLPELIRAGLKGLEVYRPLSLPDHVRRMERIARRAGLFFTGGSDWHSPDRDLPLGEFYVDEGKISTFMKAAGL